MDSVAPNNHRRSAHAEIMEVISELEAKTGRPATRKEWAQAFDYFGVLVDIDAYLAAKGEEAFA